MAAISGRDFAQIVAKVFGLGLHGVETIDIHMSAREAATVTVKRKIQDCETGQLASEFEKFVLVPKECCLNEHKAEQEVVPCGNEASGKASSPGSREP